MNNQNKAMIIYDCGMGFVYFRTILRIMEHVCQILLPMRVGDSELSKRF